MPSFLEPVKSFVHRLSRSSSPNRQPHPGPDGRDKVAYKDISPTPDNNARGSGLAAPLQARGLDVTDNRTSVIDNTTPSEIETPNHANRTVADHSTATDARAQLTSNPKQLLPDHDEAVDDSSVQGPMTGFHLHDLGINNASMYDLQGSKNNIRINMPGAPETGMWYYTRHEHWSG
ncbi:hypothetical protein P691DRAFT_784418 [Macrolepiota fuliginosa MF-IS2]|uniref:Uncharacterized protein n=1 Tax=Macrolepiota fuliginosa MF-IS2 TaxID=1400762 RepID=A0A9P6C006_9AGAR|nr:hypothetical protein P691DRAFT_784418 [Macrolepiota fuliginosa MF-IS2]